MLGGHLLHFSKRRDGIKVSLEARKYTLLDYAFKSQKESTSRVEVEER